MENKKVGYILIGVAIFLVIIILLFNNALSEIVTLSCGLDHGEFCPMQQTVNQQTYLALGIVGVLLIVALNLIFTKPKEKIIIKKVREKKKKIDRSKLSRDEKKAIDMLENENGTMFQATMMEKLGIGKVGMTRLIDKLEAKQLVERKRRGMNNVVVLRQ